MVSSRCPGLRPDGAGSNDCPYCTRSRARWRGGGVAARARGQQGGRMRRVGVLMSWDENEGKRPYSAFTQALADLGWADRRNVRMDLRWGGDDINRLRALAQELVGLQPDIILAGG